MSFLFIWQTMIQAPLAMASGAIGFAQYSTYLFPGLDEIGRKAVSGALVLVLMLLLYRRITTIGKISLFLWIGVVGTILWLIIGGVTHFDPALAFDYPPGAWDFSLLFFAGLGRHRSRPSIVISDITTSAISAARYASRRRLFRRACSFPSPASPRSIWECSSACWE